MNFKKIRTARKLTTKQLARRSGVPYPNILKYDNSQLSINNADVATVYRLESILGCKLLDKEDASQELYQKLIDELVLIEMDEGCHDDYIEDYDTPLTFYLSNLGKDSYMEYIEDNFPELLDFYTSERIRDEVAKEIKERCE